MYQNQFEQEDFWTQKQYLIWFHGKDIQKQMQKEKHHYISLARFFEWGITNLIRIFYQLKFQLQSNS